MIVMRNGLLNFFMLSRNKIYIILILLVAVSACNNIPSGTITEGLDLRVEVSPNKLFPNGRVTLLIDAENKDEKTFSNVVIDVFDKGQLLGNCQRSVPQIRPQAIESLECQLIVPGDLTRGQTVWAKVTFDASLVASQQLEVISQKEYDLRTKLGTLQRQAKSYTFGDKNMQLTIDFDEAPPFVPGKKQFMRLKIRNIGNGLVDSIKPGAIVVSSDIISCPPKGEIFPHGKEFPTIVCEVNVPGVNYLSQHLTNIDIKYSYDVREKVFIPK